MGRANADPATKDEIMQGKVNINMSAQIIYT
jgi:hypothetical protein